MSVEKARNYLKEFGKDSDVHVMEASTATVDEAAAAIGVTPGQIAKSLTFQKGDGCILVVMAGDARVDNQKFKSVFALRSKMCKPDDVKRFTGYDIGGVCPFGVDTALTEVYLDESLKQFDIVYPAAGDSNSMVKMTTEELFQCAQALGWVDIAKER